MSSHDTRTAKITKVIVTSPHIYKPVGPYSQAILVDKTLYISGVLGLDTQAKLVDGGAQGQARQALSNLKHVLEAGGSSLEAVVKTTILLGNIEDFKTVNEIYAEFFVKDCPARATFQVGKLPLGAAVEIDAIALSGDLTIAEAGPCPCSKISDTESYLSRFIADMWLEGSDIVRIIWRDCSRKLVDVKDTIDHKENFPKFVRCMKRKTLRALDRSLNPDVVPIADGINFVRFEIVDHSGNPLPENNTSFWTEKELEEGEWRHLALQRMAKIFRTHVIKFDFDDNIIGKVEYRGRRRHHLMTMMMFGVVSIGMVIIPMGFQFLAVLGGKALLLAKMALILASIQGLKKVDTFDGFHERGKISASPLSYGFYHSYPFDHYDKRGLSELSPNQKPPLPPFNLEDHIKIDRMLENLEIKQAKNEVDTREVDEAKEKKEKELQFPMHKAISTSSTVMSSVDNPSNPLNDLTTRLGEVQADYALDLPYNGIHFQSSAPVIPIRHI